MELRRLRLVNFRQHADTVLQFDRGLTGIVGPNGAGKTTVLEAIAWAVYGSDAARGTKETIRRRGAPPRSRVEVELEFDLGPHRYRVVRSLQNAELFQDGSPAPIANSLISVTERLQRLLGMSRAEFFNTFFTGQKELAIMAQMSAPERAQFLNRVLGYERLRIAQRRLKDRLKLLKATLEVRKAELPDLGQLHEDEAKAAKRLKDAEEQSAKLAALARDTTAALATIKPEAERWEKLQQTAVSLQADLKVAEHGAEAARAQFTLLDKELADALSAKAKLDELAPVLKPLEKLRAEREQLDAEFKAAGEKRSNEARRSEVLKLIGRVDARLKEMGQAVNPDEVSALVSEVETHLTRLSEEIDASRTAWVREKQDAETQRKHLLAQFEDLAEQRRRLEEAGAEGDCPTCHRPLGQEYDAVMGVLGRQLEEVEFQGKFYRQRIEQLTSEPASLKELAARREQLDHDVKQLTAQVARVAQQAGERARLEAEKAEFTAQTAELERIIAAAPERYDEARHTKVKGELTKLEPQVLIAAGLRSNADRAKDLVPRAAQAEQELSRREASAKQLRAKLEGLGWSTETFDAIKTKLREAERAVQQAELAGARAAGELTAALAQRAEVERRKEDREKRAAEVQQLADEVLLQHELDKALGELRDELNNALRPDLAELSSDFLADLTSGRYTDLDLNEDYVATIVEDGERKQVISGGEEDIANLSLRLAISQMIAERAGQPLSLLVLDEVFGSLDEERRAAVVDLLRNLADRFPQVILITHIESVREGFDRVIRLSYDVERRETSAVLETSDVAA